MKTRIAIAALILCATAFAHDLYLVSGIAGAEGKVCARVGEAFPDSTNAVTRPRIELFRLNGTDLTGEVEDKQFCAPIPAEELAEAGQQLAPVVAEMVVRPTFIKLEAKDFNEYIKGEGFKRVITARQKSGQTDAPGRELYSRYSKVILVGGRSVTRALGHALEIVPEKDPTALKSGEALPVRVLFLGQPLADVQVAAVYSGVKMEGHEFPVVTRTDANGRAVLKLDRPGLWYARLIHMIPEANDPDFEWRSFFATVTFTVPEKSGDQ
jgi:hypothetical protein